MKSRRVWLTAVAIMVIGGLTSPGHAELYRCQQPDGSIIYTDDQAVCPGATSHEPQAVVQSVPSAPAHPGQAPAKKIEKMRRELQAEEKQAQQWKKKKTDAEQEFAKVAAQRNAIQRYVNHCSRGGTVFVTKENGLKAAVSCREVRNDFANLEKRHAELAAYLDGGLQQECHRAGCLPGWVR